MQTFTKSSDNNQGEAAGLTWLAEAEATGGARVPQVMHADTSRLEIEYIHSVKPSVSGARKFGEALAHTHALGASWWGSPPAHWQGPAHVGNSRTPLVLVEAAAPDSWGEFYATCRIEHYARQLRARGVIGTSEAAVFDELCHRLRNGDFEHHQPELVREAGKNVARVHGDLWAGNAIYDGGSTGAALIDPMAHGGHAETDLAALAVFGFPYLEEIYRGYDDASPLAEGWQQRIPLHQLGMIIMHAHLFEGSYTDQAVAMAQQFLQS